MDEAGIEITLTSVPTQGLEAMRESFLLSSRLEDLSVSPTHVLSYDKGWHLFFNEELIGKIRETAMQFQHQDDKLFKITDILLNYMAKE